MKFNFNKVVFCGDSLVDENTNQLIGHDQSSIVPYELWDSGCHWAYILSRIFDFAYTNTGVCGERIKNIYNKYLNERILNYKPTFVFLDGGVNDVGGDGTSPDDTTAYMKNTIQALLDHDIQVGLIWFPMDSSTFSNNAENMAYLSEKFKTMANDFKTSYPDQFIFFNFEGIRKFGTTSTGPSTIPQNYRRDGLHFNQAGYKATAEYIAQKMIEADDTLEIKAKVTNSVLIKI